ncbi:MAG TPA: WecB/TagA/CpsF family glycosyltransferase [Xanthobacteraceae bacterium]|nr:WecB/TagA/CpsF family glycosyltransferase [Xanthobacteraceae bacterium]
MRVTLFGLPVDILSYDETVERVLSAIAGGRRCQHVALNVAKLVNARTNAELERDIRASDIVGIDGMGIVYALRLFGHRVPHRVAGADLFESLIAECAARTLRPFLLGATPAVLAAAERKLLQRHPSLVLAGSHHGYFAPDEEAAVCARIRASGAHCLFIAMPTPRKERFMHRHRDGLGVPFVMGVGGTFDVVAGQVRRAPALLQRAGLEWAFRMMQEPRRLAARYLRTNLVFAGLLGRHLLAQFAAGTLKASGKAE